MYLPEFLLVNPFIYQKIIQIGLLTYLLNQRIRITGDLLLGILVSSQIKISEEISFIRELAQFIHDNWGDLVLIAEPPGTDAEPEQVQ